MRTSLEHLYGTHHTAQRGEFFVLHGDVRGSFFKKSIGTGKRILDIGCRDGALTKSFSEGNSVVGVDIDSEALIRARKTVGIETKHIDLNGEWGIDPASYDVVVAAEVLEHLYYPVLVIGKVSRVLKEGGIFVGSVPNAFSLKNRFRYLVMRKKGTPLEDPTHINHFTIAELRDALRARFALVEIVGYGRLGWLARAFPQIFAFGLLFIAHSDSKC
ncbi:hypothetical protein A3G63_02460 [Candidatus Kaiserbacteria bacterium RIFCSPLOWO2_12_FULL_52_8]|uniref:Methyltransferase type 11 domain-containing protein n=1 Tax=Candidatus Kaiserbacteria bacterium RIFCSPHIGHO2_01_FULL_53_31 TaxID=1798481 RepID=A0A1F6CG98_9BACT|nr:MAG: hypothetical protein A2678_01580 [Candidatus Kaiserbacteria bacterium RIFCSPHIGHO2_01_FULL_53_31]OGG92757.1 MAG: hypothetical protein A3G63_02460 [Candidatus Kaiserbacteria bacterium RIFCSPLOWO2_12_FULL_52_8]